MHGQLSEQFRLEVQSETATTGRQINDLQSQWPSSSSDKSGPDLSQQSGPHPDKHRRQQQRRRRSTAELVCCNKALVQQYRTQHHLANTRSCPQGAKLYNMAPIAKIEYFRVLPRVSTANPNESQPRKRSSTLHSGFSSRSPTHKTASAGEKPRSKATPKQSKARLMDSSLASSATKPTTSKRYGN